MITIEVNGTSQQIDIEPDTPLLWVLRDVVGLTGTKFGCGIAQCGACTVHIDGKPMRSCSVPIGALDGAKITTIEGLSADNSHAVQQRVDRGRRSAMRLLPVRADHGHGRVPQRVPQSDRCRYRRQHHQHLPLWHL